MKALSITLLIIAISLSSSLTAQTKVYRTAKGERYHKKECKIIAKREMVELTIKKAKLRGYQACKVCKPVEKTKGKTSKKPVIEKKKSNKVKLKKSISKKATASRCTATTKKGTRCKRRTKNSSGRCWQH